MAREEPWWLRKLARIFAPEGSYIDYSEEIQVSFAEESQVSHFNMIASYAKFRNRLHCI
jgi:hypothetical protein